MTNFHDFMNLIDDLVNRGVLSRENMPIEDDYGGSIWSWEILKPEEIPDELKFYVRDGILFI